MFGKKSQKFKSIFSTASSFTPAEIVEEVADNGEVYETLEPIKKQIKKSEYLPGERLLLNINKTKNKQRSKVAEYRNLSKINNSITNLLKIF